MRTTCLNITFYIAFEFLFHKQKEDFVQIFIILCNLYRQLDLTDPKIIVIDWDIALMVGIHEIFFLYIIKNLEKEIEKFEEKQKNIVYAKTKKAYTSA